VVCDGCGRSESSRRIFTLLGTIQLLGKYLNIGDTDPRLPLQTAVTRFIQHTLQEPYRTHCPSCSEPVKLESLSMPEMPWLWIKFFETSLLSPLHPNWFSISGISTGRTLSRPLYTAVATTSPRGFPTSQICGGSMTVFGNLMCCALITSNTRWTSLRMGAGMRPVCCIVKRIFRIDLQPVRVRDSRLVVSVSSVFSSSKSLLPVFSMATCNIKFYVVYTMETWHVPPFSHDFQLISLSSANFNLWDPDAGSGGVVPKRQTTLESCPGSND